MVPVGLVKAPNAKQKQFVWPEPLTQLHGFYCQSVAKCRSRWRLISLQHGIQVVGRQPLQEITNTLPALFGFLNQSLLLENLQMALLGLRQRVETL